MTSPRIRLFLSALLVTAVAGCGTGTDTDTDAEPAAAAADTAADNEVAASEPAAEPVEAEGDSGDESPEPAEAEVPVGVPVSGNGWSASFPGQPEQYVEEVPLPDLGITLTNDITAYESPTEALVVMLAQVPIDASSPTSADDMRAQLFSTAAGMGTVIEDSPVLDADGTFRGRDAVVLTDAAGELTALMFVQGSTLFQVIHVAQTPDGGEALRTFVEGLTLDG